MKIRISWSAAFLYLLVVGGTNGVEVQCPLVVNAAESPAWASWNQDIESAGAYSFITTPDGFFVVNTSDPLSITQIGSLDHGGLDAFIDGWYAYIVDSESFKVVDLSDPTNPTQVGQIDFPGYYLTSVVVSGQYAYVADWTEGLRILDISDPTTPFEVGVTFPGWEARAVDVSGLIAVTISDEELNAIDISDPSNPVVIGTYVGSAFWWLNSITISGHFAYVADRSGSRLGGAGGLKIFDLSDPTSPSFVGQSTRYSSWTKHVAVTGRYAVVTVGIGANNDHEVYVLDISDPTNPRDLGNLYFSSESLQGIALSGPYVLIVGSKGVPADLGRLTVFDLASGCGVEVVFADGFESADLSAWSSVAQ